MANARVMSNQTGHDATAKKSWKWHQVREALRDPAFWFAGLNAFLSSVGNGGLTTMQSILYTTFGFTSLQTIIYGIPSNVFSVCYFAAIGIIASRWKNTRMYWMMFSVTPPLAGFLGVSLLPNEPGYKWIKWGCLFMTTPFVIGLFLAWTLIPSNVAGRTKRTVTSSFTFIGYCTGNIVGSQIFLTREAPKYTSGTVTCAVCFALQFFLIFTWRTILVMRNRRRDRGLSEKPDGLTEEERQRKGRENGEADWTDFENPYFRYTM